MPQDYYSLVTNIGLIKEAKAGQIGANPINLTEIAVGDGNGSYQEPDSAATSLVNELYRANLTSAVLDANNSNQLIIEGVIPEEAGPFYIREVGIFDSDGDLFAIGKYPETFKSNYESGSGKRLYIRLIVAFVSIPNVEIVLSENINFDPNFSNNLNNDLVNINNDIADRLQISQNLSDLADIEVARNNLNLNNGALTDLCSSVMAFASSEPPSGWLECNGAEISRTTYADLFTMIGTLYGSGDGNTSFNIPDLRGEFIRGFDNGRGVDSGRIFATNQADEFKSHSHAARFMNGVDGSAENPYGSNGNSFYNATNGFTGYRLNNGRGDQWLQNSGGNETRPRNIALIYCIKY